MKQINKEELLKLLRTHETPSGFGSSPFFPSDYFIRITKAKNATLYDGERTYIDFSSIYGTTSFGHNNTFIKRRVKKQIDLFWNASDFPNEPRIKALLSIIRLMKSSNLGSLDRVIFSNSGAEAVEAAIKLAFTFSQKSEFISFNGSYHGCQTLGSLSLTSQQMKKNYPQILTTHFFPYAYCYRCPFGLEYPSCGIRCASFLNGLLEDPGSPPYPENVAALIMEPLQGEGGYIIPPKEFVKKIRKICDIHKILLIDDEIQAGMCKSGKIWAINHYDVKPDFLLSAKALSNGYPGAAITVANHKFFGDVWHRPGSHSSTWNGNPISCSAIDATIEYALKNELWKIARKKGVYIQKWLEDIKDSCENVGDANNIGCFGRIELVGENKIPSTFETLGIIKEGIKRGLFLQWVGPYANVIRISPPITIPYSELEKGFQILLDLIKKAKELKVNFAEFKDLLKVIK